ncbi:MAG: hypothetical protein H9893_01535 [Candidatus Niameybacter stercoravium]|nr:hypothetical protein [Candidatus Niameybacter stercoravium]
MKSRSIFAFAVSVIMLIGLSACSNNVTQSDMSAPPSQSSEQIYLYGEAHGVEKILDREFELWYDYYHNQGMRHLFVELPYYTAEFLNIWVQSDNDDILDAVYNDWAGTATQTPDVKAFYEKIKSQCPETIFHGTDVGHQRGTTGKRFLEYLQSNNLEDSEQYLLAQEAIEQGKYYYGNSDDVYRENMMVENFIREFDKLNGESIMGIYGAAHTGLEQMDHTNSVPCMANQLKKHYGDTIHSENLADWVKDIEPYRVDTINVAGKDYEAAYFGEQDLSGFNKDDTYREFWRLENAYEDFKNSPKTQEVLPYNNYPMLIETGQVFVIDYAKTDGSVIRKYYRSDGYIWNNMPSTQAFTVE